jgi:AcrR family transcriptional regulator
MAAKTKPLRADAARNRDRLLTAASAAFAERGLDAPLEQVARRAGVSIGTLYNHFPTRDALLDAIFPERLADLDRMAEDALADPDPWDGFAGYVQTLFALQAQDRGLNDALTRSFPGAAGMEAACRRGLEQLERVAARAKGSGQLRADFTPGDLAPLVWGMAQVIRESAEVAPDAWRRCLAFFLDGLRAEAAHPLPVPPLTSEQLAAISGQAPRPSGPPGPPRHDTPT